MNRDAAMQDISRRRSIPRTQTILVDVSLNPRYMDDLSNYHGYPPIELNSLSTFIMTLCDSKSKFTIAKQICKDLRSNTRFVSDDVIDWFYMSMVARKNPGEFMRTTYIDVMGRHAIMNLPDDELTECMHGMRTDDRYLCVINTSDMPEDPSAHWSVLSWSPSEQIVTIYDTANQRDIVARRTRQFLSWFSYSIGVSEPRVCVAFVELQRDVQSCGLLSLSTA